MKKIISTIRNLLCRIYCYFSALLNQTFGYLKCDCRGDLATNTIGAVIIAVVIVGLLVTAIKTFFPNFFSTMFGSMSTKLNNNW